MLSWIALLRRVLVVLLLVLLALQLLGLRVWCWVMMDAHRRRAHRRLVPGLRVLALRVLFLRVLALGILALLGVGACNWRRVAARHLRLQRLLLGAADYFLAAWSRRRVRVGLRFHLVVARAGRKHETALLAPSEEHRHSPGEGRDEQEPVVCQSILAHRAAGQTYQTKAPRPAMAAIMARPLSNKMTPRLVKQVLLSTRLPSE